MDISNLKEDLLKADRYIDEQKGKLELGKKLSRLKNNPDFIDVILHGYVEVEAEKLFKILTDPTGASPYSNEEIQLKLEAISHFKGYVGTEDYPGTIMIDAESAPLRIAQEEDERARMTAAAAEDD